jgi:hypothetical protein
MLGKQQGDVGHKIENIVYVELLRRYTNVSVGKIGQAEVDFVATKDGIPVYIQVSQSVMNEDVRKREFVPLQAIADNHPKVVLTLDKIGNGNYDGIQQINLIDWLLQP